MPEKYHIHADDQPDCFNSHMGTWLIQPTWINSAVEAIRAGLPMPQAAIERSSASDEEKLYQVIEGLAIIDISGPMMKKQSKFGSNASTILIRRQLREAAVDEDVSKIMLRVTSPGGHVAGTQELSDEVIRVNAIKPIIAQVEDMCASAALWVASQASEIYANQLSEVGSIGVVAVLHDTSKLYAREGVKVHVVSTGDLKGAGTPGTEITDEVIASVQEKVDAINEVFTDAIATGRELSKEDVDDMATGDTFMAEKALELGLIDGIQTTDATVELLIKQISEERSAQSSSKTSKMRFLSAQRRRLEMSAKL